MFKIRLEFKIEDLWIGVFWQRKSGIIPIDFDDGTRAELWGKDIVTTDVWICLIPCCPIHITWVKVVPPHDDHVPSLQQFMREIKEAEERGDHEIEAIKRELNDSYPMNPDIYGDGGRMT